MPTRPLAVVLGLVSALAVGAFSQRASAEETAGNVTTLRTTLVVGRNFRPSAAIEVARAKPEIKLKDLQDHKVEEILRAAAKAPF